MPIDPLFLNDDSITIGGVLEDEWTCEVLDTLEEGPAGVVTWRAFRTVRQAHEFPS
mgnify:FL=1